MNNMSLFWLLKMNKTNSTISLADSTFCFCNDTIVIPVWQRLVIRGIKLEISDKTPKLKNPIISRLIIGWI